MDSAIAVEWVIETINADVQLQALLGGREAFRDFIPNGVELPGIAVNVQSTRVPARPLKTGPNTQDSTPVTVKTKIVDLGTYAKINQIARRVIEILDGKLFQATTGATGASPGTVIECIKGQDLPWSEPDTDDVDTVYRHIDIDWQMRAKAN